MRPFRNNNKRSRYRSNGERNFKRNGENQSFSNSIKLSPFSQPTSSKSKLSYCILYKILSSIDNSILYIP